MALLLAGPLAIDCGGDASGRDAATDAPADVASRDDVVSGDASITPPMDALDDLTAPDASAMDVAADTPATEDAGIDAPPFDASPDAPLDAASDAARSDAPPDVAADGGCHSPPIPKPGGGYWTCTFDDEFDGTSLDRTNWSPYVGPATNLARGAVGCYVDSTNNESVSGGMLHLTDRHEAASVTCGGMTSNYTLGMVTSMGHFAQAFGRFEMRIRVPNVTVPGLQESFWLWPVDPLHYSVPPTGTAWPASGEIDIVEMYHRYPDRAIPFIHYLSSTTDTNVTNNYCMIDISRFHTYVAEWTAQTITVSIDGVQCISDNWSPHAPEVKPQPFDQPFYINLTQALGVTGNAFNASTTPLPATTDVDYVRVWR